MRLRWSDGWSLSVEFTAGRRQDLARILENALIEFRRHRPRARAELHVLAYRDRWTTPVIKWPRDRWAYMDGEANTTVNGRDASRGWIMAGGYCHVINLVERAPDTEGTGPFVRGTEDVLIVGPACWHADRLYAGCIRAIQYMNELHGLACDVTDSLTDRKPPLE